MSFHVSFNFFSCLEDRLAYPTLEVSASFVSCHVGLIFTFCLEDRLAKTTKVACRLSLALRVGHWGGPFEAPFLVLIDDLFIPLQEFVFLIFVIWEWCVYGFRSLQCFVLFR